MAQCICDFVSDSPFFALIKCLIFLLKLFYPIVIPVKINKDLQLVHRRGKGEGGEREGKLCGTNKLL